MKHYQAVNQTSNSNFPGTIYYSAIIERPIDSNTDKEKLIAEGLKKIEVELTILIGTVECESENILNELGVIKNKILNK